MISSNVGAASEFFSSFSINRFFCTKFEIILYNSYSSLTFNRSYDTMYRKILRNFSEISDRSYGKSDDDTNNCHKNNSNRHKYLCRWFRVGTNNCEGIQRLTWKAKQKNLKGLYSRNVSRWWEHIVTRCLGRHIESLLVIMTWHFSYR